MWEHLSRPAACLVLHPLTVLEMPPAQAGLLGSISSPYLGGKCATPLTGGNKCLLLPILWIRTSSSSWAVLRAVCKEEGPGLPKGSGRAGSCPTNQHKHAPGRSFWPELSHDLCRGLSLRQPEPACRGWICVSLYTQQGYTPVSSCPAFTVVF